VNAKSSKKNSGSSHTNFTDLISKDLQFLLKRSLVIIFLENALKVILYSVYSNSQDKHGASSLDDFGSWN